jgi:capsular exopolysaccharide synthesis family protein
MSTATQPRGPRPVPRTARPDTSPWRAANIDPRLVSLLDPTSFEAEEYRVLRHRVEQMKRARGVSIVAVTSPAIGDGKTTTAINLAGALAQAPRTRVLLIDADLRRPSIRTRLGLSEAAAGPGLMGAILDPGLEIEVLTRHRPPFNLWVLTAGGIPELPFELLRSPRVGDLLAEARQLYDHVIIDTPPALAVPDCSAIEKCVDGFLVVVASGRTPRKLLGETLNAMDPEKVLGIVLNDDDRPLGGYASRYAGYRRTGDRPRKGAAGRSR